MANTIDPSKSKSLFEKVKHKLKISLESESDLLNQFYITLERRFHQLASGLNQEDFNSLEKLFRESRTWENARRLELLLITYMDQGLILKYLGRYMIDAHRHFASDKIIYYETGIDAIPSDSPEEGRELLLQLVEDIQQASVTRFMKKRFANLLAGRTNLFFFFSAAIFVFFYTFPWPITWEAAFYNLVMCISAGLLGACFSMLTGMKKKLETSKLQELRNQTRYVNILSRLTIGGGAALLLFFFAQSGLLGTKILPQFQHEPISEQKVGAKLKRTVELHTQKPNAEVLNEEKTQQFLKDCTNWLPNMRGLSSEEAQQRIQDWLSEKLAEVLNASIDPLTFQSILNGFSQSMWDLVRKPGYLDNAARAQMLILCILVGFSEKLVPDLLNRAESQMRSSSNSPSSGRRKDKDPEAV
jgi:hypothetical protein